MAHRGEDLKKMLEVGIKYIRKQIETNEEFADDALPTRIKDMRVTYDNELGLANGARPDFKDVVTRWAYIYSYFIHNVHLVDWALTEIFSEEDIQLLLPTLKKINVLCSIGGGPNTDSVGLRLYLKSFGVETFPKEVHVFDKYLHWKRSWHTLRGILPAEYQHEAKYSEFDFLADRPMLSDALVDVIQKADLITMIKSLSSVAANRAQMVGTLGRILKAMKPGGLLLFVDIPLPQWEQIFKDAGYETTHELLNYRTSYAGSLPMDDFYDEKFIRKQIRSYPVLVEESNAAMLIKRHN